MMAKPTKKARKTQNWTSGGICGAMVKRCGIEKVAAWPRPSRPIAAKPVELKKYRVRMPTSISTEPTRV